MRQQGTSPTNSRAYIIYDHTKVEPRKWYEISPLTNTLIIDKPHSTSKKAGSTQHIGYMLPAYMG